MKKLSWVVALLLSFVLMIPGFSSSSFSAGTGSSSSPYTVSQAIANQTGASATIQGYVVGQPVSSTSVVRSGYPNDFAVALADSASETNISRMVFVQVSTGFRSQYGLQSNPSLLGKKINVTGQLRAYFTKPGVTSTTAFSMAGTTSPGDGGTQPPSGNYSAPAGYYSTAAGKTGESLKTALHQIIDEHREISYDNVWEALRKTDEDPANPNNVILLYTGRSQGKFTNGGNANDWNREHVWAKSHGDFGTTMGPGTDLHHLRPTDASVNSTRSNLDFDNGGREHSEALGNYYDADSWEPRDEVKGDVARMLFYMDVRYEGTNGELDLELNEQVNNGTSPFHGKRSVLLQWHLEDPVDDFERKRNHIIFTDYQNNRNPFIDNPQWVQAIYQ